MSTHRYSLHLKQDGAITALGASRVGRSVAESVEHVRPGGMLDGVSYEDLRDVVDRQDGFALVTIDDGAMTVLDLEEEIARSQGRS